jgi:uncharacterized protein (DUF2252 family)
MKMAKQKVLPSESERQKILVEARNLKMARSAHAYVRGSTTRFYEWLEASAQKKLPSGPPVWICGDCHLGNLGPIASTSGAIGIQIRDLDQTVIGNPAHDLVRLGLSLASAARGSDLPGVTTVKMVEQLVEGYELSFSEDVSREEDQDLPSAVHLVLVEAASRTWKQLAKERLEDTRPSIPLGKRFWPITAEEKKAIEKLFEVGHVHGLATMLRSRDDDAPVELLDAAYWMKGCSSLGLLRFAVLLEIGKKKDREICLMDIKEATKAAAPRYPDTKMPSENGQRVLEGARHLSPHVGERMRAATLLDRSIFVRELLPQDLKLEIQHLNREEAMKASRYLAHVVGQAHARQMDGATKKSWVKELNLNRSKSLDAPSWLWTSIVELMSSHEGAYLEHCRKYALGAS